MAASNALGSPQVNTSYGAATKANAKSTTGRLVSLLVTNANSVVRYFQIHNKATAPAGSDTPVRSWPIPAGSANNPGALLLDLQFFGPGGYALATGIGWAISTTASTFTDSATAADHNVDLSWV